MVKLFLVFPVSKKILRKIYGPMDENGAMRIRYNHGSYKLYYEPDMSTLVKAGRLRRLGQLSRTSKTDPRKKLTFPRVEGIKRVGETPIRWLDIIELEFSKSETAKRRLW
jgi:hypothetical protein